MPSNEQRSVTESDAPALVKTPTETSGLEGKKGCRPNLISFESFCYTLEEFQFPSRCPDDLILTYLQLNFQQSPPIKREVPRSWIPSLEVPDTPFVTFEPKIVRGKAMLDYYEAVAFGRPQAARYWGVVEQQGNLYSLGYNRLNNVMSLGTQRINGHTSTFDCDLEELETVDHDDNKFAAIFAEMKRLSDDICTQASD